MARLDQGDIHVLDTVGRNVDLAVAGLEERIRRLEAALAASVTGMHRGIAELWRDLHAAAKPPVVVVEETAEIGEGETETASPEAAASSTPRTSRCPRHRNMAGSGNLPRERRVSKRGGFNVTGPARRLETLL
jgi:hypothetical protein